MRDGRYKHARREIGDISARWEREGTGGAECDVDHWGDGQIVMGIVLGGCVLSLREATRRRMR